VFDLFTCIDISAAFLNRNLFKNEKITYVAHKVPLIHGAFYRGYKII